MDNKLIILNFFWMPFYKIAINFLFRFKIVTFGGPQFNKFNLLINAAAHFYINQIFFLIINITVFKNLFIIDIIILYLFFINSSPNIKSIIRV